MRILQRCPNYLPTVIHSFWPVMTAKIEKKGPSVFDSDAASERENALKGEIKRLTKERKNLPKDDFENKAEISKTLKRLKKELNRLGEQQQTEASISGQSKSQLSATSEIYRERVAISESLEGWDTFVQQVPCSIYHRLEWREIMQSVMGRTPKYLTARGPQNEVVGILPIALTRSKIFGHYGVSLPYVNYGASIGVADNVEDALMQHAFEQVEAWGLDYLELRDTKQRASMEARTDKVSMVLDLSDKQDFQSLLSFVGTKVRSQVKKSLSSGIQFSVGQSELLGDFYKVFARNMRDLGTPVYSRELFAAILEAFPDDGLIVVGRYKGEPVSAAFLLQNGTEWEIPWASTIKAGNAIAANMALYATVLREVIERGATQFDFGRSSVDAPTYRFKKQWKAQPRQLYWYYSDPKFAHALTTSNSKFSLAIQAWQRLPLFVANRLGPHLVCNLP